MEVKIDGITITNPDKIIYPKEKITKLDVVKYYKTVAKYMLPYLKNRVLCAIRCHGGINEECFFKKHPTTETENVNTIKINGEEYFYIKTEKDIIYQAQMGTLEFHTWGSKIKSINNPDFMIFDLDPATNVNLQKLRQGVLLVKEILDNLNLKSYLKTSGGKGYHIVVPFAKCKNWQSFKHFSHNIALLCEKLHPTLFTTSIRKKDRTGKIFVDYLRNEKGSTCVCAYSLRARIGAPVSLPISWQNLNKITPNEINMQTALKLINTQNPWKNIYETNQSLNK